MSDFLKRLLGSMETAETKNSIHPEASTILGVVFVNNAGEARQASLMEDLKTVPQIEEVAKAGDMNYAVDILLNALDKTTLHALDHIVRAHPGFMAGEPMSRLTAMHLFTMLSAMFEAMAEAMMIPVSVSMGDWIASQPPEERDRIMAKSKANTLAALEKMLGLKG